MLGIKKQMIGEAGENQKTTPYNGRRRHRRRGALRCHAMRCDVILGEASTEDPDRHLLCCFFSAPGLIGIDSTCGLDENLVSSSTVM